MGKRKLKSGYTTGACAAAAAKASALMLSQQRVVDYVEITLPRGESAHFQLYGQEFSAEKASCFVIKDAGDDPDVTNGAEIHVTVTMRHAVGTDPCVCPGRTRGFAPTEQVTGKVIIEGGAGIGRVTKPGLAVPVGEWAINPVPRRMITAAVREAFSSPEPPDAGLGPPSVPQVLISIPNGEQLARKTLNARLGIIGGLSILGTTGIVKPVSAAAWTDTIDAAIAVALACGSETVVLSTGRTSELAAQRFFSRTGNDAQLGDPGNNDLLPFALCPLPDEAYIMMGDHVGHALGACSGKGVKHIILAAQFAKLLKIACGHEQTHVSSSSLDLHNLAEWLKASPRTLHLARFADEGNSAREVLEVSGNDDLLVKLVCGKAADFAKGLVHGPKVKVFLAGYGGEVVYFG